MKFQIQNILPLLSLAVSIAIILSVFIFDSSFSSIRWIYLSWNNSKVSKTCENMLKQGTFNVTVVRTCGNFTERIMNYNNALENITNEQFRNETRYNSYISPNKSYVTVRGNQADIFQKLHQFSQVRTIWLDWNSNKK